MSIVLQCNNSIAATHRNCEQQQRWRKNLCLYKSILHIMEIQFGEMRNKDMQGIDGRFDI